ncbi:MAG TPA: hypothetical protein VK986_18440 [Tepidisphaeraceae bacterium]|nr:hypothetical protein [Tepidisphaeraceae bacterium]
MLRAVRHTFFGLSIALVILLAGAAARSFFAYDRAEWDVLTDLGGPWRRAWTRVESNVGRFEVHVVRETRTSRAQYDAMRATAKPFRFYQRGGRHTMPTVNGWLRTLGIYGEIQNRPEHFSVRLIVPYWLPIGVLLVWPVWRLYRRARPKRGAEGTCAGCGYDLRASVGRCPECGAALEPTGPSSAAR